MKWHFEGFEEIFGCALVEVYGGDSDSYGSSGTGSSGGGGSDSSSSSSSSGSQSGGYGSSGTTTVGTTSTQSGGYGTTGTSSSSTGNSSSTAGGYGTTGTTTGGTSSGGYGTTGTNSGGTSPGGYGSSGTGSSTTSPGGYGTTGTGTSTTDSHYGTSGTNGPVINYFADNCTDGHVQSSSDNISKSIVANVGELYFSGVNDCDIWVANVLKQAGITTPCLSDPSEHTALEERAAALTQAGHCMGPENLVVGQWYVGLNGDDKTGHAFLTRKNQDGTISVADNSNYFANGERGHSTSWLYTSSSFKTSYDSPSGSLSAVYVPVGN